jgi:tol-pal system protein YbgF
LLAFALGACATAPITSAELTELKAQVRALHEENARVNQRLASLENQKAVASAVAGPPRSSSSSSAMLSEPKAGAEVPSLTVVKLKPKREVAPKIKTEVEVFEPSPEIVAAMKKIDAESRGEPAEPEEDAVALDAVYEKGVSALKTGNVTGGVEQLQRFAQSAPKHSKADNAIYFSGVGLMGLNDYEDAARAFEEVLARYPAGDAVQDSMLKLAECRMRLNKPAEAKAVYEKIVANFPGTAAATAALGRLTQMR